MRISVFRKAHFNAAHRLNSSLLSVQENERIFGKCNRPNYHGHNYDLEVKVSGEVDPVTGYLIDLGVLKDIIAEQVTDYLDHRNLNLDIPEFRDLNPTAENIAIVIWKLLRPHLDERFDLQVRLYETERNYVEFPVS
ncbi:MAG: 6-carboxytetrahydropterin synthase [Flavobacteriales bacterium]|nr:6-carboxytetrahydropterin synthase [Flavobacteriales bacterium]